MATPSEKLAESLEILHKLQSQGVIAIQSNQLSRIHRERLLNNGFIQEIMKGWYIPTRPDQPPGESTAWYASFWQFCSAYLNKRFGENWCLAPEQSLLLHAGAWTVPSQLLIKAPQGNNSITSLPHNTSLFDVKSAIPPQNQTEILEGIRVYTVAAALVASSPRIFEQMTTEIRAILSTLNDASLILSPLLEGGHSTIAGRLAGALRNIGKNDIADEIVNTMRTAGYDVRESDPFKSKLYFTPPSHSHSPPVIRMQLLWKEMREVVIKKFAISPHKITNFNKYLKQIDKIYVTDAYHSLSIEGYRVSLDLIEQVRHGKWDPHNNENDQKHKDALAARGYWQAFQVVKKSISKVLRGENSGKVAQKDHSIWYRELFSPSITAGILKPSDLAGYRNSPVYIRCSKHVPPNVKTVRDLMPAFFDLLRNESEPSVRIILGHFFFVNIHPYMDGNGRMGRFLMNLMMAAGGYPWTIIPVEKRSLYMSSLESASVNQDISHFAKFLADLVKKSFKDFDKDQK